MKVVILAGGLGMRISEESYLKPKPMIEIGGNPILWHIMKQYSAYGFNEFIICCGYKQQIIKEYFANYWLYHSDVTFDFSDNNTMKIQNHIVEPWKVTLVDTGLNTMTGGRVKRIQKYIGDEDFMLTYGDGLSNVDIINLVDFHKSHEKIATITAVKERQKFGVLDIDSNDKVNSFREKSTAGGSMINAGFMVLNPKVFDYIQGDQTIFEKGPLEKLAENGQLKAYQHTGFWQCMDTVREKCSLQVMWENNAAPWKVWED